MPDTNKEPSKSKDMTVQEAGRLGGQRERELVEEGHQREHAEGQDFGEKVERKSKGRQEA
ncbi:MAG TPA: Em GEA1 (EM1) [Candidatus Saccharimonadia bacterium]